MHYLSQTARKDWVYIIFSVTGMDIYSELVDAVTEVGAKTVLITMNKDAEIAKKFPKLLYCPRRRPFYETTVLYDNWMFVLNCFCFQKLFPTILIGWETSANKPIPLNSNISRYLINEMDRLFLRKKRTLIIQRPLIIDYFSAPFSA
jgi:hypothetical protein